MKKVLTVFFALFPSKLAHIFLKILGHKIDWSSRIGLSFIYVEELNLGKHSKIGHLNFIKVKAVELDEKAVIRSLNFFKGPFHIKLNEDAAIGKQNRFQRSKPPITYGDSILTAGKGTRITTGNYFDLTRSITFGEHSQVAGMGTQFWTHGYIHAKKGVDRIRIDGAISIGNNVYIGTRCVLNPGIQIADAINIGGNSVVSKSLTKSGMYVNQPLRYVASDINEIRSKYSKVTTEKLIEEVYTKERKND